MTEVTDGECNRSGTDMLSQVFLGLASSMKPSEKGERIGALDRDEEESHAGERSACDLGLSFSVRVQRICVQALNTTRDDKITVCSCPNSVAVWSLPYLGSARWSATRLLPCLG